MPDSKIFLVIVFIMFMMVAQFLVTGDPLINITPPTDFAQPSNATADIPIVGNLLSAGGIILGIFNAIWEVIVALATLLTFGGFGFPTQIRFLFVTPVVIMLTYYIAELIRG